MINFISCSVSAKTILNMCTVRYFQDWLCCFWCHFFNWMPKVNELQPTYSALWWWI